MSTVVRLSITGKVHQRSYRVFAQEKRSKRDGKFLEILGSVNPSLEESKQVVIKKDRIAFWQKQGAQLSPTVAYLVKNGKLPPRPKKDREKKEATPQPQTQGEAQTPAQEPEKQVEEATEEAKTQAADGTKGSDLSDKSKEPKTEPSSEPSTEENAAKEPQSQV